MRVLVTGANGLLGSHIVRALLAKNYFVRVLVRGGSDQRALHGLNLNLFEGKITNQSDIQHAVSGCEFVVHVAARTAQSPSNLEAYREPNIESTKYLIEACKKYLVKRFVYVSTANCFGNGTLEKPGNEEFPFLPWLKKSGYAYSKYLAQKLVLSDVKNNNLDAVVVNPTFIIGTHDFKPSSGRIFNHILNRKIAFYPPGGKNFVDAEEAAQGVVNAMEKGRKGECYLLAGENHSYRDFFKIVKNVSGQKTVFVQIPNWILMLIGNIGSMLELFFKRNIQLNKTNAAMLCLGNYFSPQKAIKELGFKIVPTEKSVEKAIRWLKDKNYC